MYVSDVSWWVKLWYKGIDIGASAISNIIGAGVVALFATGFWNWKKLRDLKYERQKLEQECRYRQEERVKRIESRLRLCRFQIDSFVEQMRSSKATDEAASIFSRYVQWLENNKIRDWGDNWKTVQEWSGMNSKGIHLRLKTQFVDAAVIADLCSDVNRTQLPSIEEAFHLWLETK